MNPVLLIPAYLLVLLLTNCKPTLLTQSGNKSEQIVIDRIGASYQRYPNPTNEYVLFVQDRDETQALHERKFLLIEMNTGRLVMEDTFTRGHVKWVSGYIIEISRLPGIVREDEDTADYLQHVDVRTQKQQQ